jgi:large exoprotein involved in heme utilization and adhesion
MWVGDTFLSQGGTVTTQAANADGGDIQVMAQTMVRLRDSRITTAVGSGQGAGGNITIDPDFVIVEDSRISADAFGGPGGSVTITAGVFLADPHSQVSASSRLGIDGRIDIRAPVNNLSGLVTPLTPNFALAAALLRNQCAARLREGTVSSLVERGRDGVPASPDGTLPSRLYRARPKVAPPAGAQQWETPVAAPRGLYSDPLGLLRISNWSVLAVAPWPLHLECSPR